ncbi:hypothetical protein BOW53_08640 [Solemya pervernicosa gill symbiont]|uniref:cyclic-guanylate-specific phosphodiesterase n=2 Tax=Gammaproteobacteria incertae sedis TaxID=118884 RepID=A0A1T2L540_9GAMM|nr:EAL domain-containing protein [Candidatus Reidiella endopervernicosa]OOZ40225.1 hypothetical protein BOW53_08640 [Solemya pervernicosa gill symbiont]QKQ27117.1 EAL domain-containing protein [Candidatus Reidiella endopervernicosa]
MNDYTGYLKKRILIPLSIIIFIVMMIFIAATFWHIFEGIDKETTLQMQVVETIYQGDLEADASLMRSSLNLIARDERIIEAFLQRDRVQLLNLSNTLYKQLNQQSQITHFYFTTPDRINLLRVHQPTRHSDRIERFTTLEAERSGKVSYGLELGILGTFTLRVVHPWYHQGELIGYVELGKEIDHILGKLHDALDVSLYVLIEKDHLDRQRWKEGMQMHGREASWNDYPEHIMVSSAKLYQSLPKQLEERLQNPGELRFREPVNVSIPEKRFKASFLPLEDVTQQQVGILLVLNPTEHWFESGWRILSFSAVLVLSVGGIVFILFYLLAENTENTLTATEQKLEDEYERRTDLQQEHILSLQESNQQLESTQNQLQQSNEMLAEAQHIAHIGSWNWSIHDNQVIWSDELYEIFGLEKSINTLSYEYVLQLIPNSERRYVDEVIQQALRSGEPFQIEHTIIHADGSTRFVRDQAQLSFDSDHRPISMLGTLQDITEQKQSEDITIQLAHIFDNASNQIYLLDIETLKILRTNKTATQHLGYSEAEFKQLTYSDFLESKDVGDLKQSFSALDNDTLKELRFEADHRSKDGTCRAMDIRVQRSRLAIKDIYLVIALDISERHQYQRDLQYQSLHDTLTRLPNRALLLEQLKNEISRSRRLNSCLLLLHLNINSFGEINDTLGHDQGDQLLAMLAERLKNTIREGDTIARTGGDEFALLFPEALFDDRQTVIDQLNHALLSPFEIGDFSLNVEITIGLVSYPEHGDSAEELLRHAGVALKQAKSFRSGYESYHPEFDQHSVRRLMLNSDMREAIDRKEFSLYFQPKMPSNPAHPINAEALIRWQHPEHGFISPAEFIPLAERNGYIQKITRWVLDEAASHLQRWNKNNCYLTISVNLSARNLQEAGLVQHIRDLSERWKISPEQLTFEVTETAMLNDPDYIATILDEISSMGHGISIDDFGTGYSSLSYLQRLPANELKIDTSFIQRMIEDEDSAIIVRSTRELAHNLGLAVTAEGVETEEMVEALTSLHCDRLQGYYFSRPLPADNFITWMEQHRVNV